MFCYQCEQTAKGAGCTTKGVCGKDAETAALQDLLIHAVKGIAMYAHRARELGAADGEIDVFTLEALFSTVTNVNFDPERLVGLLAKAAEVLDKAKAVYEEACAKAGRSPEDPDAAASWQPAGDLEGLVQQGEGVSVEKRREELGEDTAGLQELVMYGLKGMAAYADHAQILGCEDDEVYAFFHEALDFLTRHDPTTDELLWMALRCGEVNLKVMGLLDAAHTSTYGRP